MSGLDSILQARRSVRAFTDQPVPGHLIRECLELAQGSPSNCNVQPWRIFVASGDARDRIRAAMLAAFETQRDEHLEHPMEVFSGEYYDRQVACAMEMYGKMGVKRGDKMGRRKVDARNFALFDAPHVAIVCMHRDLGVGAALDIGIWVQTFLLALTSRGIQSCAQASLRSYPGILRSELGIPNIDTPLCGISFGYEQADAPVNAVRQAKGAIEQNVCFVR